MRQDRWQNVIHAAFLLEEAPENEAGGAAGAEERLRRVQAMLDSLLEVFPASIDPVDDFEGFAMRRLAQALRRTLGEELEPPSKEC
ncbi:hypothetical protein [Hyalangium gracile]|uniref:hypothetical protein n=1 Tax=Hyalangium gracile TaxID=394092 RepID=UPI001CCC9AC6|nr:hypothetical protein [Hyalangium gracile]